MKNNCFFIALYGIIIITFLILTVCFGRILYLLLLLSFIGTLSWILITNRKKKSTVIPVLVSTVLTILMLPFFSLISGLVRYRPNYSYYFYRKTLLKDIDVFNCSSISEQKVLDFDILMERHRGQSVLLSYSPSDIEKEEDEFAKNAIAIGTANDNVHYMDKMYHFDQESYLIGQKGNYTIYYTELYDEHQSGFAINKKENIIAIFDT